MKIWEQCVPDTNSDQHKGLEMEKEFGPNAKKAAWLRGRGVRARVIQIDGGDISGADPGVKEEVEFSLYSKCNGKPLKGFVDG